MRFDESMMEHETLTPPHSARVSSSSPTSAVVDAAVWWQMSCRLITTERQQRWMPRVRYDEHATVPCMLPFH